MYGSEKALSLYSKSPSLFLKSECLEYSITILSKAKEPEPPLLLSIFDIDGHRIISQKEYTALYGHICQRLREKMMKK